MARKRFEVDLNDFKKATFFRKISKILQTPVGDTLRASSTIFFRTLLN